jgi:ribosomal RNA-processing protein 1
MSDKPLIQQALANDLGALVMEMPASNAIPFLKAFWQIHCQEWHGLDRIR